MSRRSLHALLLAAAALTGGCATTKPWERADLARPEMRQDGDPESAALRAHVMGTREGAVGGTGQGGGGCGCN